MRRLGDERVDATARNSGEVTVTSLMVGTPSVFQNPFQSKLVIALATPSRSSLLYIACGSRRATLSFDTFAIWVSSATIASASFAAAAG